MEVAEPENPVRQAALFGELPEALQAVARRPAPARAAAVLVEVAVPASASDAQAVESLEGRA